MVDKNVTEELCNERSSNIVKSVNDLGESLKDHRIHIDLTCAEIFKLIKDRNNEAAYNRGIADEAKRKKGLSTKVTIALISFISAAILGILKVVEALIK